MSVTEALALAADDDRWEGRGNAGHPRRYRADASDLHDVTMIASGEKALLLLSDRALRWTPGGYADAQARPEGDVEVLTPMGTVVALAAGYHAEVHPSATKPAGHFE
jgi:hypothetical protein